MSKRLLLGGVLCACTVLAHAETLYVTDILRLGIHEAQDTSDKPFDNLVSGTAVEVLERVPNYARVKLADGREGWVKSTFLVEDKPAQARVAELEGELEGLRRETEAAKAAQRTAEGELGRLSHQAQSSIGSAEAAAATLERLEAENQDYEAKLELYRNSLPWQWVVPALVVALAGGFVAGLWWLDARIRRRHGGFRIY